MLGAKMETLLVVAEQKSFTKAAECLSLTQPAVSHHISQLEEELGAQLFVRGKGVLKITPKGEIALRYARRFKALEEKLCKEIQNTEKNRTNLRIGITHTAESNITTEVLAKCSSQHSGLSITIVTDTINNLYAMLGTYQIDLAIVDGSQPGQGYSSLILDTDHLVCITSDGHRLAKQAMVTLAELKNEQMILRLPTSATRILFESTLFSINESIDNFNVIMEVDNIATIKDLVRKDMGVSILPRSACMDELRKGKLVALPIENLSMLREMKIVYNRDFAHPDILQEIVAAYRKMAKNNA